MNEKPQVMPMPEETASNLEWALCYAELGIPVFPIRPKTKNEYYPDYEHRGAATKKFPTGNPCSWKTQATTDPDRIRNAWTEHPDANIGGQTGNGLYVIDTDERETGSGNASIDKWEREGILPGPLNRQTWASITGSGGEQLFYFLAPKYVENARKKGISLSGDADMVEKGSHVDTRGDGRYVLLPPSVHPNGNRYAWSDRNPCTTPIADFDRQVEYIFTHKSNKRRSQKLKKADMAAGELIPKGARYSYIRDKAAVLVPKMADYASDSAIVSALMDIAHSDLDTSEPLDSGWDGLEKNLYRMVETFRAAHERDVSEGKTDGYYRFCMRAWYMEHPNEKPTDPINWREIEAAGERRKNNQLIIPEPRADNKTDDEGGRDPAGSKPYCRYDKNGEHVIDYKFAEYLTEKCGVKRINNQLFIYRENYYQYGNLYIENVIHKLEPNLKAHERTEIIKYLEVQNPDNVRLDNYSQYILCQDQILNWKTGAIMEPSQEYVITNRIPWKYNPDAYYEPLDKALDAWTCNDTQCRFLLEEAIGTTLFRDNRFSASYLLTGQGANGKSTMLDCVKMLLGKNNVSELDIAELSDRFSTASLLGMLANIGDDISSDFLQGKQLSVFKKIVTGNGIRGEKKGQDEFFFQPYAKLFFSANDIPKMSTDSQRSISRRLIIIPFDADFVDGKADVNIEDQLLTQESMEYLLRLSVDGLKRVTQDGFTKCSRVDERKRQYERENNPLLSWSEDLEESGADVMALFKNKSVEVLYEMYKQYMINNGTKEMYIPALEVFSKRMRNTFALESYRKKVTEFGEAKKKTFFRDKETKATDPGT